PLLIQRGTRPGRSRAVLSSWRRFVMNGDYGPEEAAMQAYLHDGERRAAALGNRGPIRFTAAGELHPEIVEAYWRCGFYVFEGVLKADELADIERDLHAIIERLPVERGA